MEPKWLDCKNHCLKYMSVFLGLPIVLLMSSKVWWLFQWPCESSTCVHWSYLCGKVPCLISVDLGLLPIFLGSKTKKCWDQELVHLLAAEASSQANGSSQAVLGPKHGLLGLLLLLSVAGWHFFALLLCLRLIVKNHPPGAPQMRLDRTLIRIIVLQHWLMTFDAFLVSSFALDNIQNAATLRDFLNALLLEQCFEHTVIGSLNNTSQHLIPIWN